MSDETVWHEGPKTEEPIILNRVQEPLYLHNNVSEPVLKNGEGAWWWVQNGTLWPVWFLKIAGELWDISREGPMEKWELHPGERFTGPIPEPPKPEEGV